MTATVLEFDHQLEILDHLAGLMLEGVRMRNPRDRNFRNLTRSGLMDLERRRRYATKELLLNFPQHRALGLVLEYFFDDISQDEVPLEDISILASMGFDRLHDILSFVMENPNFVFLTTYLNEIEASTINASLQQVPYLGATMQTLIAWFDKVEPLLALDPHLSILHPAIESHATRVKAGTPTKTEYVLAEVRDALHRLYYA